MNPREAQAGRLSTALRQNIVTARRLTAPSTNHAFERNMRPSIVRIRDLHHFWVRVQESLVFLPNIVAASALRHLHSFLQHRDDGNDARQ